MAKITHSSKKTHATEEWWHGHQFSKNCGASYISCTIYGKPPTMCSKESSGGGVFQFLDSNHDYLALRMANGWLIVLPTML